MDVNNFNNSPAALVICGIVMLIMLVMGIQLIRGKWLYLVNFVAGVFGESKEKKATFNYKVIGKSVGIFLIYTVVFMVLCMLLAKYSLVLLTIYTISMFVWLFWANTKDNIKK
ncbi:MAG: hypothetical protein LBV19_05930 [Streptococcaceae bacterium]|jgi:hypothetical protein|nr:hypothetical protein [Streptococcaceae bacterium]